MTQLWFINSMSKLAYKKLPHSLNDKFLIIKQPINLAHIDEPVNAPVNAPVVNIKNVNIKLEKNTCKIIETPLKPELVEENTAEWFDKKLFSKFNIPKEGNFQKSDVKINFGDTEFEDKYCSHFEYVNKTNLFKPFVYEPIISEAKSKNIKKLKTQITNAQKNIEQEKDTKKLSKMKSNLQGLITKKDKLEQNLDKITKTKHFVLKFTKEQEETIKKWEKDAISCYNKCVDLYNDTNNKKNFEKDYKILKLKVFELLPKSGCPYDILTDEVRKFCSNLKSCETNLKNGHIKHFTMKHIDECKTKNSIFIPKTSISISIKNSSFYVTYLGKNINGMKDLPEIISDCRLNHNRRKNIYEISVPVYEDRKIIEHKRESSKGLDNGEVITIAYHGENSFGEIGKYMRNIILKEHEKIEIMEKCLKKNKNKKGKKIKHKKSLKKKIERRRDYIKNIVKELHNKSALFLARTTERLQVPKFRTQSMVRKRKYTKAYYNKVKEEKGVEEMKKELKETTKRRQLNKKVKIVLNYLSFYKFEQHLINKCNEYGCYINTNATEHETTKACTKCGQLEYRINGRIKTCTKCGYRCDRDNGASRSTNIRNTKKEDLKGN